MSDSMSIFEDIEEFENNDENKNEMVKQDSFLENVNDHDSFKEETFEIIQKKRNYSGLISVFLLTILLMVAYKMFFEQAVVATDFSYMEYSDAISWGDVNGVIITKNEVFSEEFDEGIVMSQNFEVGKEVDSTTNILLTVSKGLDPYAEVEVPDFDTTWSKTNIESWINQNQIDNFNISYMESESIEEGYLISYSMNGATVDNFLRSSEISFVISYSGTEEIVTVSDFIGGSLESVDEWAQKNDVEYTFTEEYNEIYSEGKVIYQSIKNGTDMFSTDVLEVIVSLGEIPKLVMDDFTTKSLINADAWINANNLKLSIEYENSDLYPDGTIMTQSVSPDMELYEGQTIHFVVSKGGVTTIPDLSQINTGDIKDYETSNLSITINEIYKTNTSNGDFISQSIGNGTTYEDKTYLSVTYSLGDEIELKNYIGESLSTIESFINEMNALGASLSLTIIEDYSDSVEAGRIIAQEEKNELVTVGTTVHVLVSMGPSYTVTDFSLLSLDDAKLHGSDNELTIIITEVESDEVSGTFISQSVSPGNVVSKDQFIYLEYAK